MTKRTPYPVLVLERAKLLEAKRQRHLIRNRITHGAILEAWDYRWADAEVEQGAEIAIIEAQIAAYTTGNQA